jgi:hypothetical protein
MPEIVINQRRYEYDMDPDHCPLCHHGIMPTRIGASNIVRREIEGDILQLIYLCPRIECQRVFIGIYRQNYGHQRHYVEGPHVLKSTAPYRAVKPQIPDEIQKISPDYVEVLSQSEAAEAYQLDQIAGAGYRKALEFLIKDYAIIKNPEKADEIKNSFLGNCIKKFVTDQNVKECSKRAAWLGNDETHYIRKWEEKDINDLKILIKLTQAWILNSLLTESYLSEMSE